VATQGKPPGVNYPLVWFRIRAMSQPAQLGAEIALLRIQGEQLDVVRKRWDKERTE